MDDYGNAVKNNLSRMSQGMETFGGLKMNCVYAALTLFCKTGNFGPYCTRNPCIKIEEAGIVKDVEQLYTSSDVQNTLKDLAKINREAIVPDNITRQVSNP